MAFEFLLPDIGEGLTEAEVVRWLVAVGDHVGQDEPLVEVETDKAVVDIPAPVAGVVLHHGAAEGDRCEVGSILAVIGESGEAWGEAAPEREATGGDAAPGDESGESDSHGAAVPANIVGTLDDDPVELRAVETTERRPDRPQALPLVRRLAREHGIDLAGVEGSGPGGRVEREDILALVGAASSVEDAGAVSTVAEPVSAESEPPPVPAGDRRERMTKLRRTIAARMLESWTTIPHVTTFDEIDATRLLDARRALAKRHDTVVPLDALVVAAVTPVLRSFPEFNAIIDGEDVVFRATTNIGVAVDAPDGLMVPVIKDADRKPVIALAEEIGVLAEGALSRTLEPDQLRGSTFTVSNIGAAGGGLGTPIIPPGTSAILSVGRAIQKPVVVEGTITARPMMPLALSYDHRLIDGGLGRRFMAQLIENLEEPALFLA